MRKALALLLLGLMAWPVSAGASGEVLKSDNVTFLGKAPATTWIHRATFHGDLVFTGVASDYNKGFEIFRLGGDRRPVEKIATFPCTMIEEGTISHWKHFVFQALETKSEGGPCGPEPAGIRVVNVSDPRNPHKAGFIPLNCGSHGITTFPFKGTLLIYNTNGCSAETATAGSTGQGGHLNTSPEALSIEVIEFDPRRPSRSKISAEPIVQGMKGCHDLTVYAPRMLAICTGTGRWAVLDVSDPFNPATVATVDDVNLGPGSAQFTWDGQYVMLNKIPFRGSAEYLDCFHWLPHRDEIHGLNVWNIEDPTNPVRSGRYLLDRSPPMWEPIEDHRCHAANFTVVPMKDPKRYVAVTSWGGGGMSVIDFSDPGDIKEIAYYQPQDANIMWWAAWYNGRVYVTQNSAGEDVPVAYHCDPPTFVSDPIGNTKGCMDDAKKNIERWPFPGTWTDSPASIHALEVEGLGPRETRYFKHGLVTQWQDPEDLRD